MRSMNIMLAAALFAALVTGPVLAQEAVSITAPDSYAAAPATPSKHHVKKHHVKKHHAKKHHHRTHHRHHSRAAAPEAVAQ